jgi:hypothetical protein
MIHQKTTTEPQQQPALFISPLQGKESPRKFARKFTGNADALQITHAAVNSTPATVILMHIVHLGCRNDAVTLHLKLPFVKEMRHVPALMKKNHKGFGALAGHSLFEEAQAEMFLFSGKLLKCKVIGHRPLLNSMEC